MSDQAFAEVGLGLQSNIATAVAASVLFGVDAGWLGFELDRATESPDEDYGIASREYPGRESHGVRLARSTMPFTARYEDLPYILEMHVVSIGTPVGAGTPYTWTYTFDESGSALSDVLALYTIEYGVDGSTQDEWRAYGVFVNQLELGFDALSAPGNSMWKGSAELLAVDREVNALTGTAAALSALETMEGHRTTLAEGTIATAFGSLSALTASLKQFQFRSNLNGAGRAYGGTSDLVSKWGRTAKGEIEFDALVAISATADTNIHDIYNVATSVATERRWRISVDGDDASNTVTIDGRVRFRAVNLGEHDGERLYAISGVYVYDSTLGGRMQIVVTNTVATLT